jgi:hypothetical protein
MQDSQDYNLYIHLRVAIAQMIIRKVSAPRTLSGGSAAGPMMRAITRMTKSLYCHFV